jgi:hypothetical protein
MGFIGGIIAYFISLSPYFSAVQLKVLTVAHFLFPFLRDVNLF